MKRFFRPSVLLIFLGCIFVWLSVSSAMRESLTYDEIVHIQEGKNAWIKREFLIDTNNPPLIRELAVLPLLFTGNMPRRDTYPNVDALPARLVIVVLALFLGYGIFRVTKKYFGIGSALFATTLYAFEPTMLGVNHLVTQDLGSALFFFLGYMSLIIMIRTPSWKTFIFHGVCIGLLATTKITLLAYYAFSALIIVAYMLHGKGYAWRKTHSLKIMLSIFICMMVIWSTYFFRMSVVILPSTTTGRVSERIREYATSRNNKVALAGLTILEHVPIPLGDYIAVIKNTAVRSTIPAKTFFLGQWYPRPQWYFMLVTFVLKTPIPLLILTGIGMYTLYQSRKRRATLIILTTPIIAILAASALSPMQPFVRYILPVYPFLTILAAASLSAKQSTRMYIMLWALFLWLIVGTAMQFPHFISYANEFAGDKSLRYQRFTDSNIDWGQGLITLSTYVRQEKPSDVRLSYFGRDDASRYGFPSHRAFGSYKAPEICAFHDIAYPQHTGKAITVISVSNWHECGYFKQPLYQKTQMIRVIGSQFLVFDLVADQKIEDK